MFYINAKSSLPNLIRASTRKNYHLAEKKCKLIVFLYDFRRNKENVNNNNKVDTFYEKSFLFWKENLKTACFTFLTSTQNNFTTRLYIIVLSRHYLNSVSKGPLLYL